MSPASLQAQIPETWLPPNPSLEFLPGPHRYLLNGQPIPYSVTRICSFDKPPETLKRFKDTQHIWEPRGVQTHLALETFLTTGNRTTGTDYDDWIEPLLEHRLWQEYTPIAVEHRMASPCGLFAGSCDAVLVKRDEPTKAILVDLKTQSSASSQAYSTHRQMGAYCRLLEQNHNLFVHRCVTVWAKPGMTNLTIATPDECVPQWFDALDAFKLLHIPF